MSMETAGGICVPHDTLTPHDQRTLIQAEAPVFLAEDLRHSSNWAELNWKWITVYL